MLNALLVNTQTGLPWPNSFAGPRWGFPSASEYVWDFREAGEVGAVAESLTQQYLRLDVPDGEDRWGGTGYEDWDLGSLKLSGTRIRSGGGFGSQESQYKADDQGEDLHKASETAPENTPKMKISWTRKPTFNLRTLKRAPSPEQL